MFKKILSVRDIIWGLSYHIARTGRLEDSADAARRWFGNADETK